MSKAKVILGIETSCDETAAAILIKDGENISILAENVASSAELQAKWGGVVPEEAARQQLESIIPVITETLNQAKLSPDQIDAIAVTQGPGLIGSLLVGVETAKTLSLIWNKPLIPINHLIGHFYANWIKTQQTVQGHPNSDITEVQSEKPEVDTPSFPCLGLLVSGGHTDLVLFTDYYQYQYLGGTRDDAAGECFDKSARLLNLPYPGGPKISKLAAEGNADHYPLPIPMLDSNDLDFSFSGLKTAVANLVRQLGSTQLTDQQTKDICASLEKTIIQSLIRTTKKALKIHPVKHLMIAGGVAANNTLQTEFSKIISQEFSDITLHLPNPKHCTDNAVMIAAAAFFHPESENPLSIQANPNLELS